MSLYTSWIICSSFLEYSFSYKVILEFGIDDHELGLSMEALNICDFG